MNRSWKDLLKAHLTNWVQMRDEHRLMSGFNGSLRSLHEPTIEQTLAAPCPTSTTPSRAKRSSPWERPSTTSGGEFRAS